MAPEEEIAPFICCQEQIPLPEPKTTPTKHLAEIPEYRFFGFFFCLVFFSVTFLGTMFRKALTLRGVFNYRVVRLEPHSNAFLSFLFVCCSLTASQLVRLSFTNQCTTRLKPRSYAYFFIYTVRNSYALRCNA